MTITTGTIDTIDTGTTDAIGKVGTVGTTATTATTDTIGKAGIIDTTATTDTAGTTGATDTTGTIDTIGATAATGTAGTTATTDAAATTVDTSNTTDTAATTVDTNDTTDINDNTNTTRSIYKTSTTPPTNQSPSGSIQCGNGVFGDHDLVPMDCIRLDGGTQSRAAMDDATISEYTDALCDGATLPPLVVYFDGVDFWLADGFHRFHAYRAASVDLVAAEVRTGLRRDAVLFSVGANAAHGLRRNNEDKRRAVKTLLADAEWAAWPHAKIAQACGVSREFVSRVSSSAAPSCDRSQDAKRTVERGGKTYEQNTANIGKAKGSVERPATEIPAAAPATAAPELIPTPADTLNDTGSCTNWSSTRWPTCPCGWSSSRAKRCKSTSAPARPSLTCIQAKSSRPGSS